MPYFPSDEGEVETLRNQVRQEKLLASRYLAHPDPRDPDWPGHWLDDETPTTPSSEDPSCETS